LEKLILEDPSADDVNVNIIKKEIKNIDLILAVGSGTINDLCKITSYQNNIPYIIFATAASMNGYASANASITINNHKKSLQAKQPLAIYCDLNILANSPVNLIKAGIGDSLCYYSCYFDWFLSHLILKTEFKEELFQILAPYQEELIKYDKNDFKDQDFIKILIEILIISGLTMYIAKGSYSASQSEHLIAHFLDMKHPDLMNNYFHGQKIAITTITTMKRQNRFLEINKIDLQKYDYDLEYFINLFNGNKILAQECFDEVQNKAKINININDINSKLEEIQNILAKTTVNIDKILKIYQKFELFDNYKDILLIENTYEEAVNNAYLIRNRFTILDLVLKD
jgi:glycerol-1-phosphate dehydrogenase [NAD(P)+]